MNSKKKFVSNALFGSLTGFINGFFGGGGGMIVVPILSKFFGLTEKQSHATSISIILPITVASIIIYVLKIKLDWVSVLLCSLGVSVGGVLGAWLLDKISSKAVNYVFCAVMFVAGIKMLFF